MVELRITVCHSIYIYEFLAAHVLQLKACSCVCDCSGMFQQGRMMQQSRRGGPDFMNFVVTYTVALPVKDTE